jgi:hypothetical protein
MENLKRCLKALYLSLTLLPVAASAAEPIVLQAALA